MNLSEKKYNYQFLWKNSVTRQWRLCQKYSFHAYGTILIFLSEFYSPLKAYALIQFILVCVQSFCFNKLYVLKSMRVHLFMFACTFLY